MKTLYQVSARVLWTTEDGWETSAGIPTFLLDPQIQGIVNEDHAKQIAEKVINPTGNLQTVIDVLWIQINDDSIVPRLKDEVLGEIEKWVGDYNGEEDTDSMHIRLKRIKEALNEG